SLGEALEVNQNVVAVAERLILAGLQGQCPKQLVSLVDRVDALFTQFQLRVAVGLAEVAGEAAADDEGDRFLAVVACQQFALHVGTAEPPAAEVDDVPFRDTVLVILVLKAAGPNAECLVDAE